MSFYTNLTASNATMSSTDTSFEREEIIKDGGTIPNKGKRVVKRPAKVKGWRYTPFLSALLKSNRTSS